MQYKADIKIMPLKAMPDPQGNNIAELLQKAGYKNVNNVRMGKHMTLIIEAESKEEAMEQVNDLCNTILVNPLVEGYDYQIKEL
jgi:phosphoribosylformylglycinamidine synthase subunit PurS